MSNKIKKVMLINPSNTMPGDSVRRLATPLGLLYIGSVLKQKGFDVKILDSPMEGYFNVSHNQGYVTYGLNAQEVEREIRQYSPDIVGVSSMFSAQQGNAIKHCGLVKKINKNIPVVLGGIHPSLFPEECVSAPEIDYVISGEGEYRMLQLIDSLNKNEKPKFDGIAFRDGNSVVINKMITRIEDLDSLPIPDRDLIDFERYISIGVPYAPFPREEKVEQIMTSRGCPFRCNFCSTVNFWGRKFRTRSVDNIIGEMEGLVKKYGIREVQFSDDNMTVDKERARQLFQRMIPLNLKWCTPHGLMAKTLDTEMINLMADSGAYQLTFAIESGSERVLKEIIHKDVPTKSQVKSLLDACHKREIQVHGMFVLGLPGERREEIMETLQYPFDVGFDSVSYFIANPIPGSELYRECEKKGYLAKDRKMDFKASDIVIPRDSPDFIMPSEELIELVDKKTREFNEFSKMRNPGAWEKKFKKFLEKHGDKANLILGRVT